MLNSTKLNSALSIISILVTLFSMFYAWSANENTKLIIRQNNQYQKISIQNKQTNSNSALFSDSINIGNKQSNQVNGDVKNFSATQN